MQRSCLYLHLNTLSFAKVDPFVFYSTTTIWILKVKKKLGCHSFHMKELYFPPQQNPPLQSVSSHFNHWKSSDKGQEIKVTTVWQNTDFGLFFSPALMKKTCLICGELAAPDTVRHCFQFNSSNYFCSVHQMWSVFCMCSTVYYTLTAAPRPSYSLRPSFREQDLLPPTISPFLQPQSHMHNDTAIHKLELTDFLLPTPT